MVKERFCLSINLSNLAISQYCYYSFNSFCQIGDKHFGANEDGIFGLEGETDNGVDIDAYAEFPVSDFGISNVKRVRSIYFGYEAKGDLIVTVKNNEGNARPYTLSHIFASYDRQTGGKVDVNRDGQGRYFSERIDNTGGCYFAIDNIEVLAIILGRKPR